MGMILPVTALLQLCRLETVAIKVCNNFFVLQELKIKSNINHAHDAVRHMPFRDFL